MITVNELYKQLKMLKETGCGEYAVRIPDGDNIDLDKPMEKGVHDVCYSHKFVMFE